ncbi:MAG: acyl-CoA dehydratase activase-related protein [Gemmatimonadota bacterium]
MAIARIPELLPPATWLAETNVGAGDQVALLTTPSTDEAVIAALRTAMGEVGADVTTLTVVPDGERNHPLGPIVAAAVERADVVVNCGATSGFPSELLEFVRDGGRHLKVYSTVAALTGGTAAAHLEPETHERLRRDPSREIADLFAERRSLLLGGYREPDPASGRPRVGLPSAMLFHDLFPFWRAFFDALDHDLVLSDPTNPPIVRASAEGAPAETCFPVKLVFGHVANLLEKGIHYLFLPSVINRENSAPGQGENQYCPYIPAVSHLVRAHVDLDAVGVVPLHVSLELSWVPRRRTQLRALAPVLGVSRRRIVEAAAAAEAAQAEFQRAVRLRGARVLAGLDGARRPVVLVGRAYNTQDQGATLDLPLKLRRLGALPIPMDFLPLDSVDVSSRYPNMYWRSGQDILAAASIIRDDPRLQAVYVTNFSCGPDSFLTGFFRRLMGDKPYLELEIDDHTADTGVLTRCEAFLESLEGLRA